MQPTIHVAYRRRLLGRTLAGLLFVLTASWIAATAVAQTAPPPSVPAEASSVNLNITPKRLILGRGTRTGSIYVFNQGNVAATFDIAFVERIMLPNGEIRAVAEAGAEPALAPIVRKLRSAQPFVAVAPRRVVLAPGKGQTIRIRATQPADAEAEYRTHLTVTSLPPRDAGLSADQVGASTGNQLSFRITSAFGISIPVFLRGAPADAKGALANIGLSYADVSPNGATAPIRTAVLSMDIQRLGASSLYGNVEVRSGRGGAPLGVARGVGVYPEVDSRQLSIPLTRAPRQGEALEIIYTDDESAPGRVIAKTAFDAR